MRENLAHVFQEQAERFFDSQSDSYAIMQLDSSKVTPFEPFSSLRLLEKYGLKPNAEHYNIVYTDTLPAYQNIHVFLESVYSRFNMDRPEDFKGHSLSVSDIVAIRQADVVPSHFSRKRAACAKNGMLYYTRMDTDTMVIRAGLEPRITALKGLCPYHLDERTRFTGSFLPALGIGCNKNIINAHTEECCKNDQIIDSRERSSTLPLVNRLRGMEPKDNLYVCNGKPSRLPQSYNIGTGPCQINGGNVHH